MKQYRMPVLQSASQIFNESQLNVDGLIRISKNIAKAAAIPNTKTIKFLKQQLITNRFVDSFLNIKAITTPVK